MVVWRVRSAFWSTLLTQCCAEQTLDILCDLGVQRGTCERHVRNTTQTVVTLLSDVSCFQPQVCRICVTLSFFLEPLRTHRFYCVLSRAVVGPLSGRSVHS